MKILAAPNAFKGTLTGPEAATAMKAGIRHIDDEIDVQILPVADGGDGTLEAFVRSTGGEKKSIRVAGPLMDPVEAELGILGDGDTAIVEMARASGLALIDELERDPIHATTLGTGQLMCRALEEGCSTIIVGIGGSATVDGGTGMARALGYRFLNKDGQEVPHGGGALDRIESIDTSEVRPELEEVQIYCACDVTNPLIGDRGAARVYGPQKGASPVQVEQLELNLTYFQDLLKEELGVDVSTLEGGGAAGGLGAGLHAFCDATLKPGVELVFNRIDIDGAISDADLVLSGEGEVERSSLEGKAAVEVCRRAKRQDVPCFLICGQMKRRDEILFDDLRAAGVSAVYSISSSPSDIEDCLEHSDTLLKEATGQAVSGFLAGRASCENGGGAS